MLAVYGDCNSGIWCDSDCALMFLNHGVQENIAAFDIKLPEEAFKDIEKIHATFKDPSNKPIDD